MRRHLLLCAALAAALVGFPGCALFGTYDLTLTVSPMQGGTVAVTPEQTPYHWGQRVTISATPAQGYVFAGYTGGVVSSDPETSVLMTGNKEVTAVFSTDQWTVLADPVSGGTVQVARVSPARGDFPVREGDVLRLTAVPSAGYEFYRWTGELTGTTNPTTMTVSGLFSVTAQFAEVVTAASTYPGSGSVGYLVGTSAARSVVDYTLSLGPAGKDVYFVFTNTGTQPVDFAAVTRVSGTFGASVAPPPPRFLGGTTRARPMAIRGNPLADAFYAEAAALRRGAPRVPPRGVVPGPLRSELGAAASFMYNSTSSTIPATCQYEVTNTTAGATLHVYVADASWGAGTGKVTIDMVNGLAGRFLAANGTADIYSWETAIFGKEWGTTGLTASDIPFTGDITILLYDIDGDGTSFLTSGGTVGFFWAKDNFLRSSGVPNSNQRIMFYLDAPMLAHADGTSWHLTDSWPEEVISTLAHEFQHMIHYYQKDVLKGGSDLSGADVWLNEMCSMVAEDFVSDKLLVRGPRGVDPTDGSAGAAANTRGYLPIYAYYDETPLAYWPASSATIDQFLASYATNYAFGAYLARNYGGTLLLRDIVQNQYTGRSAIDQGLQLRGFTQESFASTLRKWGVSVLVSDNPAAPQYYAYNTGSWISANIDASTTYRLGSINLFNYEYSPTQGLVQTGPYYYTPTTFPPAGQHSASSTYFLKAATGATGDLKWLVRLEQDVALGVVVK